jgi:mannose-6-phosphate isomerase-like protein (cupin superfamily)
MKLIFCVLLLAASAWPAGEPAGFHYWSAAELKGFSQSLTPKITAEHLATQSLLNFGNYSFMVIVRSATGQSEWHGTVADVMMVQSGQATLVYGGEMVGGQTIAPNEIRGSGIRGGLERKVGPGDVVTIPVKTPHQMRLDPGQQILYMTMKVTQ